MPLVHQPIKEDRDSCLLLTCGLKKPALLAGVRFGIEQLDYASPKEALTVLTTRSVHVLVVGPLIAAADQLLVLDASPESVNIALDLDGDLSRFQPFIDADRLFYLSKGPLSDASIHSIVAAALRRQGDSVCRIGAPRGLPESAEADFLIRLSFQTEPAHVCRLAADAALSWAQGDRSQCLLYDAQFDALTTFHGGDATQVEAAATGVAGYSLRTGETVALARASQDPRFDAHLDDPQGTPGSRLLVVPVPSAGSAPAGVITVARHHASPEFSAECIEAVRSLATLTSAKLSELHFRATVEDRLLQHTSSRSENLFLREAIDHHAAQGQQPGTPMLGLPSWLRWSPLLNAIILGALVLYAALGRLNEYASGPARIRSRGRETLVAGVPGLVLSVAVGGGDRVKAGDLLIQIQTPGPRNSEPVRSQLRASRDSLIGDVRVHSGQLVGAAEPILTLVNESSGYEASVILPGSMAPKLRAGMPMVLRIDGYPDSSERLTVTGVPGQIISGTEATQLAGSLTAGPIVVVRTVLKSSTFAANGRTYYYQDGMTAAAEIIVESNPMLFSLVPRLRAIRAFLR
ncbi:MAG: hypothetical protein JWN34_794 [Bryobacterales bacterium]|nr:hypothetical protein [Bryobacterales bacterium]